MGPVKPFAWKRIDRLALVVDDVDATAEDFRTIFGIEFICFEVPDFQLRVGVSDGNLEIVARLAPDQPTTIDGNFAGERFVAAGFKVESVPEVKRVMLERGIDLYNNTEIATPGGMVECMFMRTAAFGGIPISCESYPGDSFVAGVDPALGSALPGAPVERLPMVRASLVVPDLDSAVRDFEDTFGMTFSTVLDEELGLALAISDEGLTLVCVQETTSLGREVAENWADGVLASIGFRVDDIEKVQARLAARGVEVLYRAETDRMREVVFSAGAFHGLPIALYEYAGDSFVEALGARTPEEYDVRRDWERASRQR